MSTVSSGTPVAFPAKTVEGQLRAALVESAAREALLNGIVMDPCSPAIGKLEIDIDSLEVVDLICSLDEVLGFEVGEGVVKVGGYGSVDEALADLMPKLLRAWQKHHRCNV